MSSTPDRMDTIATAFLSAAQAAGALRFGSFTLKSGRQSPYFFNAGAFHTGQRLAALARAYAARIADSAPAFDLLFGPAYKGIPLVAATALAGALEQGRDWPWSFNRKEAKDHGEGGLIVGAPLAGRVLIVDDVITAGTAIREAVGLIRAAGATVAGVVVALDRQERGNGERSARQEVEADLGVPVLPVATLSDLLAYTAGDPALTEHHVALLDYRAHYGVESASDSEA